MSQGCCPKCKESFSPFSSTLFLAPFHMRCPKCHVQLRLKSYRLLFVTVFIYLVSSCLLIWLIPSFRNSGLAVIACVLGWLLIYRLISRYVFNITNLEVIK